MPDSKKKSKWLFGRKTESLPVVVRQEPLLDTQPLNDRDIMSWDVSSAATISTLLGTNTRGTRSRFAIYEKFTEMEANPFIGASLRLHVTAALAGDPDTGNALFIETKSGFEKDKQAQKLIGELRDVLAPLLNEAAAPVTYNALAFGDGYARPYGDKKRGVYHILTDESVRPPLIVPFERGGQTMGYVAYSGERPVDKLTLLQLARMKMPRLTWIPQASVTEKHQRLRLSEDEIESLPPMPAMIGGSLLYNAEAPYDDLNKTLLGLVGQRWVDSMDEQILTLNMESMSKDQQDRFLKSIKDMLLRSKNLAEQSIKDGKPMLERIRHLIPVWGDKGMASMAGISSQRGLTVSIDDVMFHSKALAGSLGTDLSMIGFADLLSGGLGEGGFFRTSAQIAESSGSSRRANAQFCQHIIDIHTYLKYGFIHAPQERPYILRFFGTISALENEKQNTRLQSMNAGGMMIAGMQQLKDLGFDKDQMQTFLTNQFKLDEEEAILYAKVVDQPSTNEQGQEGDFGDFAQAENTTPGEENDSPATSEDV